MNATATATATAAVALLTRFIQLLLPWLPMGLALVMVQWLGVYGPHYDDWGIMASAAEVYHGDSPPGSLFRLHSEHHIFTARLVTLAFMPFGDGIYKWLTVWHFLMLAGTSLLIFRLIHRSLPGQGHAWSRSLIWTISNVLLFHPATGINWTWSCQVTVCNLLFFLVAAVNVLESGWPVAARLAGAAVFSLLAMLSHGAGLAVPGMVLVWLMVSADPTARWKVRLWLPAVWGLFMVASLLPFLVNVFGSGGAQTAAAGNPGPSGAGSVDLLHRGHFLLSLLGNPLAMATVFRAEISAWFFGTLVVLAVALLTTKAYLGSGGVVRRASAPWIALASFGIATGIFVSLQRSGISQACSPRFISFTIWALIPQPMLFVLIRNRSVPHAGAASPSVRMGSWPVALWSAYAVLVGIGAIQGLFQAVLWKQFRLQDQAEAAFCHLDCFPAKSKVLPPVESARATIRQLSSKLDGYGLLPFPLVSGNDLDSLASKDYAKPFRIRDSLSGKSRAAIVASGSQGDQRWFVAGYAALKGPPLRVADTVLITHRVALGSPRTIVAFALCSTDSRWLLNRLQRPKDVAPWQASFSLPQGQTGEIEAWTVNMSERVIAKMGVVDEP
jgi:hypothetical protein